MTQLPIVDASTSGAVRHDVGSGNGRPVEHPCRVAQFGIAGFRNPNCYRAGLLERAANVASRSQTGSKADQGQHEIARPLRRETVNSSAGSKASRTAQIVRLARTGHYKGYVHAKALNAGRLRDGLAAPKASTTLADADAVRPTPT